MRSNAIVKLLILLFFITAEAQSTYEVDGSAVHSFNKTNGPKAVVRLNKGKIKNSEKNIFNSDSIFISLQDSIHWLEMEKNTDYTICVENASEGLWRGNVFLYKKDQNCILLNSGNFVKNGKIWYVTKFGNVFTFNILVGMKYIDLSTKKHKLGFFGPEYKRKPVKDKRYERFVFLFVPFEDRIYPDPARLEKINKVLVVDKYKVTDCEFVQTLWDSIPNHSSSKMQEHQTFWVQKKKSIVKNGYCDVHDSAAIYLNPYLALMYANARSLRDGFTPVYTIQASEEELNKLLEDGSFGIMNQSLNFPKSWYVEVSVNENANGYRLPYYNEWMALARGGTLNTTYVWGESSDSAYASQYAWFGVQDPEDPKTKLDLSKGWAKSIYNYSCGSWWQKSRPVGMLKPNSFELYDMSGLVCELVMLPGKSIFSNEILSCKGGFLTDPLDSLNLGRHCDYKPSRFFPYNGLRLIREIK